MGYLSVEHQKAFSQRYKTTAIVVMAFCTTVLIYMLASKLITPKSPIPDSERWSRPIYTGVMVIGLAVVVIRRILFSERVMRPVISRGINAVLDRLQKITTICCMVAEIVAVVGFAAYLRTADYQYVWRLGVVSLLLLLYSFPRRGEWERAAVSGAGAQSNPAATMGRSAGF